MLIMQGPTATMMMKRTLTSIELCSLTLQQWRHRTFFGCSSKHNCSSASLPVVLKNKQQSSITTTRSAAQSSQVSHTIDLLFLFLFLFLLRLHIQPLRPTPTQRQHHHHLQGFQRWKQTTVTLSTFDGCSHNATENKDRLRNCLCNSLLQFLVSEVNLKCLLSRVLHFHLHHHHHYRHHHHPHPHQR